MDPKRLNPTFNHKHQLEDQAMIHISIQLLVLYSLHLKALSPTNREGQVLKFTLQTEREVMYEATLVASLSISPLEGDNSMPQCLAVFVTEDGAAWQAASSLGPTSNLSCIVST